MISIKANFPAAYRLFHEGALVLADMEANGIRVDVEYCKGQLDHLDRRIRRIKRNLENTDEVKLWKRVYKDKFNLDSAQQLGKVLFEHMDYRTDTLTATGKLSTSRDALESLDIPIVQDLLLVRKLAKIKSTYIEALLRETVDGFVHPFFNLHIPVTYRSSSDSPNFQNIPVRDPEMAQICRKAFIPRSGRVILEVDFSGVEVRVSCCYNLDPVLIDYIRDPSTDMHRDMAMECYMLTPEDMGKKGTKSYENSRYCAKNKFVFPQFYGDYFVSCTKSLWEAIHKMKLATSDGTPMDEHLRRKGIRGLGILDARGNPSTSDCFYAHIRRVQDKFWNDWFKVYTQWKLDWVKEYERVGYFDMYTGFRCSGLMRKNEIINYPVQGSAFHCLLWVLVELSKVLKVRRMGSLLIGQVHDSLIADTVPEEMGFILETICHLVRRKLPRHWPWIIVPMDVEAEATGVDRPWHEKKKIDLSN